MPICRMLLPDRFGPNFPRAGAVSFFADRPSHTAMGMVAFVAKSVMRTSPTGHASIRLLELMMRVPEISRLFTRAAHLATRCACTGDGVKISGTVFLSDRWSSFIRKKLELNTKRNLSDLAILAFAGTCRSGLRARGLNWSLPFPEVTRSREQCYSRNPLTLPCANRLGAPRFAWVRGAHKVGQVAM
jgi:hypothetical protein